MKKEDCARKQGYSNSEIGLILPIEATNFPVVNARGMDEDLFLDASPIYSSKAVLIFYICYYFLLKCGIV